MDSGESHRDGSPGVPGRRAGRRILLGVMILGTFTLSGAGCEPTGPCIGRKRVCWWDDQCCSGICSYWPDTDPPTGLCL
jgi:hypothetical protein